MAAVGEGAAAITISRGGYRKPYSHTDPNEDAVCFAWGRHGSFAAVADGHHGARGAERAVDWLLRERAAAWTDEDAFDSGAWSDTAAAALQDVHRDLHLQADELKVAPAPTTLSLAVVRPADGVVLHASVGDSHVFLATSVGEAGHVARDLAWATTGRRRCAFAGEDYESPELQPEQWVIGSEPLQDVTAVVLVSDGVSERGIGVDDPAACAAAGVEHGLGFGSDRQALEACRHVTETALESHRQNRAGDNVAAAVLWASADE